ncbi:c-type cytochrome [Sinisalibacter aestuarii]|uniref:Cytochrome c n=1 Tax=Sinisalibacter aestuarii TaxID=2949426 RepID=A0ABQ5LTK2_9RHOB|nr:cytochrome c [Sinisalibacter aestuarii]GKY88319.1 cytochrome c [Sinisalibacter aestuarii]
MRLRAIVLGAFALALTGCEQEPMTGAGLYGAYCAGCHGNDARGGAEAGAPDLTGLARRHGGAYPAVYVMSTIDGYAREATHGPMPIFGELIDAPVETWVDPEGVPTPTPVSLMLLNEYLQGQQEG